MVVYRRENDQEIGENNGDREERKWNERVQRGRRRGRVKKGEERRGEEDGEESDEKEELWGGELPQAWPQKTVAGHEMVGVKWLSGGM
ncbi:hypothetical protein Pmani_037696 [Petrolisthes manimaculis]|uniref:Uncharacterized protein n=1 Tax=Petrolisthes manimaculis TaxID=1843537 RepID=A0AAE1NFW5_9EUCA|nr:hypothetical protein Pmani_037696 [Petrolisthes manimaculis]